MKLNIYVVFDNKAMTYNRPFFVINDAIASRMASDHLNDKQSEIARHPADFSLFHLGEYDDQTAKFDLLASPRHMFGFHEIQASMLS